MIFFTQPGFEPGTEEFEYGRGAAPFSTNFIPYNSDYSVGKGRPHAIKLLLVNILFSFSLIGAILKTIPTHPRMQGLQVSPLLSQDKLSAFQ